MSHLFKEYRPDSGDIRIITPAPSYPWKKVNP